MANLYYSSGSRTGFFHVEAIPAHRPTALGSTPGDCLKRRGGWLLVAGDAFTSLNVWHSCDHWEAHAVPQGLSEMVGKRVEFTLSQQRCWRCVLAEAWENLPPWTPANTRRRRAPKQPPGDEPES